MAEQRNPLLINSRSGQQYRSIHCYNDSVTSSELSVERGSRNESRPRAINFVAVLLSFFIVALLGLSCMNLVITFLNDAHGLGIALTCPATDEDTQYLIMTVNSTYILPVPDNKEGVKFAFTNDENPELYDVTLFVSSSDTNISQSTNAFHTDNPQCKPSKSANFNQQNCFIVRYWPPDVTLYGSAIFCSNHSDKVYIVWKWFPFESAASTSGCAFEQLIYECPSDLSLYPTCNKSKNIFQDMLNNRPSSDYKLIVIQLCSNDISSEHTVNFEAELYEHYSNQQLKTDETYRIGKSSNGTTHITIPFTGNERYLAIQLTSFRTISPTKLKFNYIHHDTMNIDGEVIEHTYIYINAVTPIILAIAGMVVLCCTCYIFHTTRKQSVVETNKSKPRVSNYYIAFLMMALIICILLVQTSLNLILIIKDDHNISCPARMRKESHFLLLTESSSYILPLQDNQQYNDGVMFSFTNYNDASDYIIYFKMSNSDRKESGRIYIFGFDNQQCGSLLYDYRCYIVRYWPPNMTLRDDSNIHCDMGYDTRVLWKWIDAGVKESCSDYGDMFIDCNSNTTSSTTCDDQDLIDKIISDRPPVSADSMGYQTVVIQVCPKTRGNGYSVTFFEAYEQLSEINAQYTMGIYSNNTNNVTIPFTGNEQNIQILLVGYIFNDDDQTFEPIEIMYNYIYHDTLNIVDQLNATTSIPVEYIYMYMNAGTPIILAIITLIVLCSIC